MLISSASRRHLFSCCSSHLHLGELQNMKHLCLISEEVKLKRLLCSKNCHFVCRFSEFELTSVRASWNRLESPNLKLLGIIVIISSGVLLTGKWALVFMSMLHLSSVIFTSVHICQIPSIQSLTIYFDSSCQGNRV